MTIALAILAAALLAALVRIVLQSRVLKERLARYEGITDAEQYRTQCQKESLLAIAERDRFKAESSALQAASAAVKNEVSQYRKVVADFKTAAELQQYVKKMSAYAEGCRTLGELHAKVEHHTHLASQLAQDAERLGYVVKVASDAGDLQSQIDEKRSELASLHRSILAVEEVKELQEFGFYRRKYELASSDAYKRKTDAVRDRQKGMIKSKQAATCDTEWTVEGSKAKGRKMVNDKIKLLLRAFNGESDAAIAKVSHSNATSMEGRITRSFEQINRMGEVNQVRISTEYYELKLQELYLTHEYQLQKEEEKEEQRRIKEQMKEEAKVEREIEKACLDAEREESIKRTALEQARAQLIEQEGRQTDRLAALVNKLETELQEALDRKAKAIARAQLTKSGHVYVLSNIGSFGEGVYKIGMTRRLEPLERVKELGSASVPFLFDVHAMIYSENAPELEARLHRAFSERRVNFVNMRKEFFRVSLPEIQDVVAQNFGTVTFMVDHDAYEYRQSVARLAEGTHSNGSRVPELAAS
jgi:hypothetical protein